MQGIWKHICIDVRVHGLYRVIYLNIVNLLAGCMIVAILSSSILSSTIRLEMQCDKQLLVECV